MASRRDRAIAVRVLREQGMTLETIGNLLGVHPTTAMRDQEWLGEQEQGSDQPSAVDHLEALLATQDLDALGRFKATVARQLARKLDVAAASTKAMDASAVPDIAKALRDVVDEIMDVSDDDKEWLANMFAPVGDPTDGDS